MTAAVLFARPSLTVGVWGTNKRREWADTANFKCQDHWAVRRVCVSGDCSEHCIERSREYEAFGIVGVYSQV